MQGVHQHGTDARMLRHQRTPFDSILQQRCTQFDPLGTLVNSQSGQHHYRNWVRHIASHRRGCHLMRYRPCRQRVVTYNGILSIHDHKSATSASELVGIGPSH